MAASTQARSTAPFLPPGGFERTIEYPSTLTEAITDCFRNGDGRGYIVIKRLETTTGQLFWHIERWVNHGSGPCRQDASLAATTRDEVESILTEESNIIRGRGHPSN